jgi:hypothetical protein
MHLNKDGNLFLLTSTINIEKQIKELFMIESCTRNVSNLCISVVSFCRKIFYREALCLQVLGVSPVGQWLPPLHTSSIWKKSNKSKIVKNLQS